MYGEEVESSVLHNVSEKAGYASLFIRLAFCSILLVHIPYYFLPAKECILLMYFEHKQRFLSDHLEQKLAETLEATKKKEDKDGEASDSEEETDPMIAEKQGEGAGARKRSRGDTFTEDDKDEESDGKEQEEGLEVEGREE